MKICENCCFVSEEKRCPVCGSKNLRSVEKEKFCLLTEKSSAYCDVLTSVFDEKEIPFSALPYGSGVETRLGLPLKNYRIFVPFGSLEEAKSVMDEIDSAATEQLRSNLLQGIENLNVSPRTEKKIKRKSGLSDDKDIFVYCVELIKTAEKIVDG